MANLWLLNPAHAGMDLIEPYSRRQCNAEPRIRGDGPLFVVLHRSNYFLNPAHAGMAPSLQAQSPL